MVWEIFEPEINHGNEQYGMEGIGNPETYCENVLLTDPDNSAFMLCNEGPILIDSDNEFQTSPPSITSRVETVS